MIATSSRIHYHTKKGDYVEIAQLSPQSKRLNQIRGSEIAMIFQEPSAAFSPLYTIGQQMTEGIRLHRPRPIPTPRHYSPPSAPGPRCQT